MEKEGWDAQRQKANAVLHIYKDGTVWVSEGGTLKGKTQMASYTFVRVEQCGGGSVGRSEAKSK